MANIFKDIDSFKRKLKSTPRQDQFDIHYWADYIEIKCLFNPDGIFSKDDFLDCLHSNKDFSPKKTSLQEDNDDEDFKVVKDTAYKNDKIERFADSCYKLIKYRIRCFKEYYPFNLSDNKRAILKNSSFTWENRCYTFLLFSSSLRYVIELKSVFTSSFEIFSLMVLKSLLPEKAEAHLFGSSNSILKKRRFKGHIYDKFNTLRSDLNEPLIRVNKKAFPKSSSGDGGFDLVAWIPNGDKQSHMITYTGQSACTEIWDVKQYSSSALALSTRIPISVFPINIIFIPFSIRGVDGEWHRGHDIVQCVLLDRQRLLYHFDKNRVGYQSLPINKIIIELLKVKDSPYN